MTKTRYPYRTRTQATLIEGAAPESSLFQSRLDTFARRMILRAYKVHGNKRRAAAALGLTYRAFRYQWARLMA